MPLISFDGISINIELKEEGEIPILFVHGFAGSSEDWVDIMPRFDEGFRIVRVDLPGFGKSDKPESAQYYTQEFQREVIKQVLEKLDLYNVILAGYSMGGRVALDFALTHSNRLKLLVLESSSPGIEDSGERELRVKNDIALSGEILEKGIDWFVQYWPDIELFRSQKSLPLEIRLQQKERRLKNSPVGLSNSLRGFSTGSMTPLWSELCYLSIPTLLITGQSDQKFTEINRKMDSLLSSSKHCIVENTGHNVHIENPREFVNLMNSFISEHRYT